MTGPLCCDGKDGIHGSALIKTTATALRRDLGLASKGHEPEQAPVPAVLIDEEAAFRLNFESERGKSPATVRREMIVPQAAA